MQPKLLGLLVTVIRDSDPELAAELDDLRRRRAAIEARLAARDLAPSLQTSPVPRAATGGARDTK